MTPDLARIAQAIGECRQRYDVEEHSNGIAELRATGDLILRGKHADCLAYIDARCAEAAVRAIAAQPVAWRVMDHDHGWILRRSEEHALREAAITGGKVQPLFALETQS